MKKSYEFEVGDRVRYDGHHYQDLNGSTGIVTDIDYETNQVFVHLENSDCTKAYNISSEELED